MKVGGAMKSRILLIEDNPDDATLVMEGIAHIDGEVDIEVAVDGEAGLIRLRHLVSHGTPPDLIISNYNLPKLNGPQVLAAVKADEALRTIPFIMLTSSNRDCDRKACAGAHAYLIKGSTWVDIQAIAQKIIDLLPPYLAKRTTA